MLPIVARSGTASDAVPSPKNCFARAGRAVDDGHIAVGEYGCDGGILAVVEAGELYGGGFKDVCRFFAAGQDVAQFGQAVAFGLHHLVQGAFHFLVTAVVEQLIDAELAESDPVWHVAGIEHNFHPIALHVVDNALFIRVFHMRRLCEKTHRLACAQLVRLVAAGSAFHHDECFIAQRKTRLYNLQRVPTVAALYPFGQRPLANLAQVFLQVFVAFAGEQGEQVVKMVAHCFGGNCSAVLNRYTRMVPLSSSNVSKNGVIAGFSSTLRASEYR